MPAKNASHSGIYTELSDESTVKVWAEAHRVTSMDQCDNLNNTAVALHPAIKAKLREYGLDEQATGMFAHFRRGSAQKIADEVETLMRKAAEFEEAAAAHVVAAEMVMRQKVFTPIEMAKRAEESRKKNGHGSFLSGI